MVGKPFVQWPSDWYIELHFSMQMARRYNKQKHYHPKDLKLHGMIYCGGIELRASGIITHIDSYGGHYITVKIERERDRQREREIDRERERER